MKDSNINVVRPFHRYVCKHKVNGILCGKVCTSKLGFISHKRDVHPELKRTKPFRCVECGRSFTSHSTLTTHIQKYHQKFKQETTDTSRPLEMSSDSSVQSTNLQPRVQNIGIIPVNIYPVILLAQNISQHISRHIAEHISHPNGNGECTNSSSP